MPTNQEIVAEGVKEFARVEQNIFDAIKAIGGIPDLVDQGYVNGAVDGAEAIKFRCQVEKLRGDLGCVLSGVLDLHVSATNIAKANNEDIAGPYSILPPTKTGKSGDR